MDDKGKDSAVAILLEVIVYAGLVVAYFFLVLHYMGNWLMDLYQQESKQLYAVAALLLIICQGLVLETITTTLLRWIRSKMD